jgi:carboxyl-terminal processing protease
MMRSNRARLLFVTASVVTLLSLRAVAGPGGKDPATRALTIFSDVFALTRSNYVESVDSQTLLEGAYDGMSDALDAFSFYVPAAERAAFRAHEESGAINPGLVVARRGGFPYVVGVVPGSPAATAGVAAGDLIDSVDGKSLRHAPLWRVRAAVAGPEGSRVDLALFRPSDEKRVHVRVTRGKFKPEAGTSRIDSGVLVAKVPAVSPATAGELRKAIDDAKAKGATSLVLDLRGAIGGEMADAAAAAGLFTGKGTVARLVTRKLESKSLESTGEKIWNGRTVVLVDDATGGASEVLAAALRDRAGATTVGETTIGMAIQQKLVPTESGGSLFLTIGRYVSPNGTPLGNRGLTPDERVVTYPGDADGRDAILERAMELARETTPARRAA